MHIWVVGLWVAGGIVSSSGYAWTGGVFYAARSISDLCFLVDANGKAFPQWKNWTYNLGKSDPFVGSITCGSQKIDANCDSTKAQIFPNSNVNEASIKLLCNQSKDRNEIELVEWNGSPCYLDKGSAFPFGKHWKTTVKSQKVGPDGLPQGPAMATVSCGESISKECELTEAEIAMLGKGEGNVSDREFNSFLIACHKRAQPHAPAPTASPSPSPSPSPSVAPNGVQSPADTLAQFRCYNAVNRVLGQDKDPTYSGGEVPCIGGDGKSRQVNYTGFMLGPNGPTQPRGMCMRVDKEFTFISFVQGNSSVAPGKTYSFNSPAECSEPRTLLLNVNPKDPRKVSLSEARASFTDNPLEVTGPSEDGKGFFSGRCVQELIGRLGAYRESGKERDALAAHIKIDEKKLSKAQVAQRRELLGVLITACSAVKPIGSAEESVAKVIVDMATKEYQRTLGAGSTPAKSAQGAN